MPGCAKLCMASKIGWRKAVGISSLNTPEEVSTRRGEPCSVTSDTQSAEDKLARW
jgi:hypothetical protein